MSKPDPRRDPTEPPPRSPDTEVRRRKIVEQLELDAPTPSLPPGDEPGGVLRYMLALHHCARSDAANAQTATEQAIERADRVIDEVDDLKGRFMALEGTVQRTADKVEQLESRLTTVINAQVVLNTKLDSYDRTIAHLQTTFESALTNFDARLSRVERRQDLFERRQDSFEARYQKFQEIVMRNAAPEAPPESEPASGPKRG